MDEEIKQYISSILVWSLRVIDEDNLLNMNFVELLKSVMRAESCRLRA